MTTIDEYMDEVSDDLARQTTIAWREAAIETLDSVGGRLDYDVQPVIDSVTPVTETSDGYSFTVTHPAASIFEFGSEPHTITPNDGDVLAFQQNGETVFAKEVDHPGTDAILYISKSQQRISERGFDFDTPQ